MRPSIWTNRNQHTNKVYILNIRLRFHLPNVRKLMSILIIQIKDVPNNIGDIDPIVRAHFAHEILANDLQLVEAPIFLAHTFKKSTGVS